jgi:hypothetical protein
MALICCCNRVVTCRVVCQATLTDETLALIGFGLYVVIALTFHAKFTPNQRDSFVLRTLVRSVRSTGCMYSVHQEYIHASTYVLYSVYDRCCTCRIKGHIAFYTMPASDVSDTA